MIKSMTGYSRFSSETRFGALTIELKAWNHRYCNVTVRSPNSLSQFEHRIQNLIKRRVTRGQIQVSIELLEIGSSSAGSLVLDLALAKQYHQKLVQLQNEVDLSSDVSVNLLAGLPGVFDLQKPAVAEEETWAELQSTLETALDQLNVARQTEGNAMCEALSQHLGAVRSLAEEVQSCSEGIMQGVQEKLEIRLKELLSNRIEIDPDRLVMEAGLIASRSDISEELVRLDSHCKQFEQTLQVSEPVGRRLDFISQEMNREVNTIASKASSRAASSLCVSLKAEIEKIRELVQNVE
ncbi:MAG: YicC family protein [Candidatus Poribacteria bacterium]|nr:YicC family protein [Candidatus Poribacteria bacterium]